MWVHPYTNIPVQEEVKFLLKIRVWWSPNYIVIMIILQYRNIASARLYHAITYCQFIVKAINFSLFGTSGLVMGPPFMVITTYYLYLLV